MKLGGCIFIVVSFSLSACTMSQTRPTTVEILNSWKTKHVSELIRSWGPADRITSDGSDGMIYVWDMTRYVKIRDGKTETQGTVEESGIGWGKTHRVKLKTVHKDPIIVEREKIRMFWVDRNGFIYDWQAKGSIRDKNSDARIGCYLVTAIVVITIRHLIRPKIKIKLPEN